MEVLQRRTALAISTCLTSHRSLGRKHTACGKGSWLCAHVHGVGFFLFFLIFPVWLVCYAHVFHVVLYTYLYMKTVQNVVCYRTTSVPCLHSFHVHVHEKTVQNVVCYRTTSVPCLHSFHVQIMYRYAHFLYSYMYVQVCIGTHVRQNMHS